MFEEKKKDKVEIVSQKKQEEKKDTLVGRITRMHRGHKLFKVNKETLVISEATYTPVDYVVGEKKPSKRVDVEEGCAYVPALNEKNALKRFLKLSR